jgi:hypothetical protein
MQVLERVGMGFDTDSGVLREVNGMTRCKGKLEAKGAVGCLSITSHKVSWSSSGISGVCFYEDAFDVLLLCGTKMGEAGVVANGEDAVDSFC